MSTITAILEADADGTHHLPAPAELRRGTEKVQATLEAVDERVSTIPPATPEMLRKRKEAFEKLRQLNPFRDIADPVAWQREIRQDRPLPGRD
jgi:hypothetical protein